MVFAIIVSFLSGCSYRESIESGRILYVYNDGVTMIIEDTDTGVQYLCIGHSLCPMFNPDGTIHTHEDSINTKRAQAFGM